MMTLALRYALPDGTLKDAPDGDQVPALDQPIVVDGQRFVVARIGASQKAIGDYLNPVAVENRVVAERTGSRFCVCHCEECWTHRCPH